MRLKTTEEIKAYYQGKMDGVTLYAWWKEGVQYVGTCGTMLADAETELVYQRDAALRAFSEGKEIWAR